VALARALAVEPEVLLLDEPFGALDAKVRKELRAWLRRLHDEVHVTSVFVTHDQEEAMEVADEIVIMNEGRIEQIGSPAEIFDNPANPFVINFIGEVNVLPSTAPLFAFASAHQRSSTQAYVRPHEVDISLTEDEGRSWATVQRITHLGWEIQIELELEDKTPLISYLTRDRFSHLHLKVGQQVYAKPKKAHFYDVQRNSFLAVV
jgi:sulfate transport system ATP-binding protein